MLLGKITGKVTTRSCKFTAEHETKNFEYVKIYHPKYDYVLGQVVELEATTSGRTATCNVIGYREDGRVKLPRIPFEPGTEVMKADDDFIKEIIALPAETSGAYLGKLEGRDIPVHLDLRRLLTKHVAILAKSGAGKSYAVGVLIEEILEKGVPVVIIDPHGEHHTLKEQSTDHDTQRMARFNVTPKNYKIVEYGNPKLTGANPFSLSNTLSRAELVHMLPKLNTTQLGLLYSVIRSKTMDFDTILAALEAEESMAKWSVINLMEALRNHNIFSADPTPMHELVKPGTATIINLKGYPPEMQEIITYKIASDLFALRKQNKVAPFFLVLEEAHNFCPERSFGESSSSKILRTIASEGRKFGLGLCAITQRPARIDKSVLSQCTTQMILKVTNPHDLRAISTSVEGLTGEVEKEIRNLSVGTALVTGVVDMPLIVNVRPRRTAHGGEAVDILDQSSFEQPVNEVLPLIFPTTTKKDVKMMSEKGATIMTRLRPAVHVTCTEKGKDEAFPLLIDLTNNEVVTDVDDMKTKRVPGRLGREARDVLKFLFKHRRMKPEDLNVQHETMQRLQAEGYVALVSNDSYKLSGAYLFNKLKTATLTRPLQYESVKHDKKLHARHQPVEAEAMLRRFVDIKETKECWIVQYVAKNKK